MKHAANASFRTSVAAMNTGHHPRSRLRIYNVQAAHPSLKGIASLSIVALRVTRPMQCDSFCLGIGVGASLPAALPRGRRRRQALSTFVRDAPRPDAVRSATVLARSASQGTRVSAARHALALGAREHGGTSQLLRQTGVEDVRQSSLRTQRNKTPVRPLCAVAVRCDP
jgi:hypothetical protein